MITGFQAQMSVDDAGTGAASGGTSTRFVGLTTFELGEIAVGTFDATELDQDVSGTDDPYERELPTGLLKVGDTECEIKYTKANYQRLCSLAERGRGYTFVIVTPDDLTTPGTPVKLTVTLTGFVKKVGKLKFEKGQPVLIPFTLCTQSKPARA